MTFHKTKIFCSMIPVRRLLMVVMLLQAGSGILRAQKTPPSHYISNIPFTTFTGGVVVIRAQLEGVPDTLNFIMDTGSAGISLDSLTCLRLHLKPELTDRLIAGIGGVRQLKYIRNRALLVGNMRVDSLNFHVGDYDVLSSVYGNRIDGIIGYSFFSRYIVKIDYDSSQIYVFTKGSMRYPSGGFTLKPTLINLPVISGIVRDSKEVNPRFYFDTGADLCLLLNSDFLRDSSVLNPAKKPLPTQAQGMGGKTNMRVTTMRELKLGPYRFKNIPVHIFDDEFNITSYPYLAGLIGNDVLRRFNLILNYDKKIFYLIPNKHFNEPFDYSYTGLGLYWVDGEIRVGDIMKDSPAEKGGFELDDVVISVNNNTSQNLQLYKSMLQNTGDKVKIRIRRPNGEVDLNLRVKSIF